MPANSEVCVAEVFRLIDAGAASEIVLALTTGRMTLNKARRELRLPPLDCAEAEMLLGVDPNCVRYGLTETDFREACNRWVHDETHLLGSLPDYLREVAPERFQHLLRELAPDLSESDHAPALVCGV